MTSAHPTAEVPDGREAIVTRAKPLVRARDRNSLRVALDLWSHGDVALHAGAILERLNPGTMRCDGDRASPADRVDVFRRWVNSGKV
jgi:hypothetical protein